MCFDFEGLRLSKEQAELLTVLELVELLELRRLERRSKHRDDEV